MPKSRQAKLAAVDVLRNIFEEEDEDDQPLSNDEVSDDEGETDYVEQNRDEEIDESSSESSCEDSSVIPESKTWGKRKQAPAAKDKGKKKQRKDKIAESDFFISKDKTEKWNKMPRNIGAPRAANIMTPAPGITRFAIQRVSTMSDAFLFFLYSRITECILTMTNKEGASTLGEEWNPISQEEIYAYFGLSLLAGVYRSCGEALSELWSADEGRPIFRAVMIQDYFSISSFRRQKHQSEQEKER